MSWHTITNSRKVFSAGIVFHTFLGNFRNQLKTVKKNKFTMDDDHNHEEHKKPDWALGEKEGKSKSVSEPPPEAAELAAPWPTPELTNPRELFSTVLAFCWDIFDIAPNVASECC